MKANTTNDKIKLIENFIAMVVTQIVTYVMPFISLPYLSRVLGVEKFGLVFWAQSCMVYFIILTDYGFNLSAVREIAINRNDKYAVSNIFNSVMVVKFILILISFCILTLLILIVPQFKQEWLLFYLTFFMVIGNALYPIWYFQGIEHMKYVTFLKIVSQSIFIILIFIFIKSPSDYYYVAILNSLGFIISGVLSIFIAIKRFDLKIFIPDSKSIIDQFRYSSEFFFAKASETLYTNTNSFILGLIATPVFVGYYVSAEKIFQAVHMLTAPIGITLYPYIAKSRNVQLYKKVFTPTLIFILLVSVIIYFIAPHLITIFYGQEMLPAYKILRIFSVTVIFSATSGLIGYPLVAAMGHTKIVNYSLTIAAFIHIIMLSILYLIKFLNIKTIAWLTILPYAIMLSIRVYGVIKYNLWSLKKGGTSV